MPLSCIADEWEQSITESHPACDATEAALEKHRQEVAAISAALSKCQPGLQQMLSAAKTLADAAAQDSPAAVKGEGSDSSSSSSSTHDAVERDSGQEAVSLLQQVAAHVKWF